MFLPFPCRVQQPEIAYRNPNPPKSQKFLVYRHRSRANHYLALYANWTAKEFEVIK